MTEPYGHGIIELRTGNPPGQEHSMQYVISYHHYDSPTTWHVIGALYPSAEQAKEYIAQLVGSDATTDEWCYIDLGWVHKGEYSMFKVTTVTAI